MSYFCEQTSKNVWYYFANRNKNYGAYAIRSAYGSTVFKSSLHGNVLLFVDGPAVLPQPHERYATRAQIMKVSQPWIQWFLMPRPRTKREEPSHPSTPPPTNQSHPNSHPIVTDRCQPTLLHWTSAVTQPSAQPPNSSPDDIIIPGGGGNRNRDVHNCKKNLKNFRMPSRSKAINIKEFYAQHPLSAGRHWGGSRGNTVCEVCGWWRWYCRAGSNEQVWLRTPTRKFVWLATAHI